MKNQRYFLLETLCATICFAVSSFAVTIRVPADQPTIQEGINAAARGDTVLVAPGEYDEWLNFRGKSIVLVSEAGPSQTFIRFPGKRCEKFEFPDYLDSLAMPSEAAEFRAAAAAQAFPVVILEPGSDSTTIISGFTIDGKDAVQGICCVESSPAITDCIVQNGRGFWDGGGMFFQHCAPLVQDCIIRDNYTPITGAGIFIRLGVGFGTARFIGNEFYGNRGGNGPAISLIEGDGGLITRNIVHYNSVPDPGSYVRGVVYFRGSDIRVINNTVAQNSRGMIGISITDVDVRNNIIDNNDEGGLEFKDLVGQSSNVTWGYNDVVDNGDSNYLGWAFPAETDISVNPIFDTSRAGQYYLTKMSPCVDAGDPDSVYNDPDGGRNDIGARPYRMPHTPVTLRVPSEYSTIQAAISAAIYGDTVLVAPGIYTENLNFMGKSIVLLSEEGAQSTIIKTCPNAKTGLGFPIGLDSLISPYEWDKYRQQAVSVPYDPVIVLDPGSDGTTRIIGFTINGCDMVQGIHCVGSHPEISHCIVENCRGYYDGGGMFFQRCIPRVYDCVIRNNYTLISGAGIFIRLGCRSHGTARFINNIFHGNRGGNGPAISLIEGKGAVVEWNLVYDNHVPDPGSIARGVVYFRAEVIKVCNNTIDRNSRGMSGVSLARVTIRNNIITNNFEGGLEIGATGIDSARVTWDCNDVWNNGSNDYMGQAFPGENDISANPLFCDINERDYRLMSNSPCLPENNVCGELIGAFGVGCGDGEDGSLVIYDPQTCIGPDGRLNVPVYINAADDVCGLQLPLRWNGALHLDSVILDTTAVGDWEFTPVTIDNDSQRVLFGGMVGTTGTPVPAGDDELVGILAFSSVVIGPPDIALMLTIDTTTITIGEYNASLLFVGCEDPISREYVPFVDISPIRLYGCCLAGDANGNGEINVGDAMYLVKYIFENGPPPPSREAGDANGDCVINVADIVYLINYLFKGGPAPVYCGEGAPAKCGNDMPLPVLTACFDREKTVIEIESAIDLYGIEFVFECNEDAVVTNLINGVQLYSSYSGGIAKAGLLDINGENHIPAGKVAALEISGHARPVSAVAADEQGVSARVMIETKEALPDAYRLDQNQPNPFNPFTQISFNLPEASGVILDVFNITGQKVATLINADLTAGIHHVGWDGADNNGQPVTSGIYFYRLRAGNFIETKKMMLVK